MAVVNGTARIGRSPATNSSFKDFLLGRPKESPTQACPPDLPLKVGEPGCCLVLCSCKYPVSAHVTQMDQHHNKNRKRQRVRTKPRSLILPVQEPRAFESRFLNARQPKYSYLVRQIMILEWGKCMLECWTLVKQRVIGHNGTLPNILANSKKRRQYLLEV